LFCDLIFLFCDISIFVVGGEGGFAARMPVLQLMLLPVVIWHVITGYYLLWLGFLYYRRPRKWGGSGFMTGLSFLAGAAVSPA